MNSVASSRKNKSPDGGLGNGFGSVHRVWGALLSLLVVSITGTLHASDRWETLQAIHWVENPNNDPAPGAHGELGAYQFRRSTWFSYTQKPFEYARERLHADEVAVMHYEWLKRSFVAAGIEATPYRIALAWNAGLNSALRGRAPRASHDYATRVTNIVESLKLRTAKAGQE
jgi:hypothetical protein